MKRDALVLLPVDSARPLRVIPGDSMSAEIREAMRAALKGDFGALDRIELRYLNLLVRIGEFAVKHADGAPHLWFTKNGAIERYGHVAPFVVAIHRGAGPNGHAVLEWWLAEKCRRCEGRLQHGDCRVCGGDWYVADASDWVLTTDTDGVLVYDEEA